jgi:hypothetical protein
MSNIDTSNAPADTLDQEIHTLRTEIDLMVGVSDGVWIQNVGNRIERITKLRERFLERKGTPST